MARTSAGVTSSRRSSSAQAMLRMGRHLEDRPPRSRRRASRSRPGSTTRPCGRSATTASSAAVAGMLPVEPAAITGSAGGCAAPALGLRREQRGCGARPDRCSLRRPGCCGQSSREDGEEAQGELPMRGVVLGHQIAQAVEAEPARSAPGRGGAPARRPGAPPDRRSSASRWRGRRPGSARASSSWRRSAGIGRRQIGSSAADPCAVASSPPASIGVVGIEVAQRQQCAAAAAAGRRPGAGRPRASARRARRVGSRTV